MKKQFHAFLLALVSAAALAAVGCQALREEFIPEPGSDRAIASAAMERLGRDTMLSDLAVSVQVENSVATVFGTVRNAAQRARILSIVDATDGVAQVVDNLTIR